MPVLKWGLLISLLFCTHTGSFAASYPACASSLFSPHKQDLPLNSPPGELDQLVTQVQKMARLSLSFGLLFLGCGVIGSLLLFLGVNSLGGFAAITGFVLYSLALPLLIGTLVFLILGWLDRRTLKSKLKAIGDASLREEYLQKIHRAGSILTASAVFFLAVLGAYLGWLLSV